MTLTNYNCILKFSNKPSFINQCQLLLRGNWQDNYHNLFIVLLVICLMMGINKIVYLSQNFLYMSICLRYPVYCFVFRNLH